MRFSSYQSWRQYEHIALSSLSVDFFVRHAAIGWQASKLIHSYHAFHVLDSTSHDSLLPKMLKVGEFIW